MSIEKKKKLIDVGENENLYTFICETNYEFPSKTKIKTVKQIASDGLEDILECFETFLRGSGFILENQHLEFIENE